MAERTNHGPTPPDEIPEILARVTDEGGRQAEIRRGPLQHASLSADQLRRIARLRDVLAEVYPMTLDGWVDGFMRDLFAESEICTFEACAVVYQELTAHQELPMAAKKQLFGMLVMMSAGVQPGPETALPAGLPAVETIVTRYREAHQARRRP